MRCLYCGKELALLKRLTGGGEFCSDAHKQSYQEEYNRLALSRLLQAQSKGGEKKPAEAKAGKTAPSKTAAPAAARIAVEEVAVEEVVVEEPVVQERMVQEPVAEPAPPRSSRKQAPPPEPPAPPPPPPPPPFVPPDVAGFFAPKLSIAFLPPGTPYVERWLDSASAPSTPEWQFQDGSFTLPLAQLVPLDIHHGVWQGEYSLLKLDAAAEEFSNGKVNMDLPFSVESSHTLGHAGPLVLEVQPVVTEVLEQRLNGAAAFEWPVEFHSEIFERSQTPIAFSAESLINEVASEETRESGLVAEAPPVETAPVAPSSEDAPETAIAERAPTDDAPVPALEELAEPVVAESDASPRAALEALSRLHHDMIDREEAIPQAQAPDPSRTVEAEPEKPKQSEAPAAETHVETVGFLEIPLKTFPPSKAGVMINADAMFASSPVLPRMKALPLRPKVSMAPPGFTQPARSTPSRSPLTEAKLKSAPGPARADVQRKPLTRPKMETRAAEVVEPPKTQPPAKPEPAAPAARSAEPLQERKVTAPAAKAPAKADTKAEAKSPVTDAKPSMADTKPAAKADASTPDISKPDARKQDPPRPEASQPDTKPNAPKPNQMREPVRPRKDSPKPTPPAGTPPEREPSLTFESLELQLMASTKEPFWGTLKFKLGIAILLVLIAGGIYIGLGGKNKPAGNATNSADFVGPSIMMGEGGWVQGWAGDTLGSHAGRQITIYRPSLSLSDYRIEFQGQIENKSLGWVFRAADPDNYYAMKLGIVSTGLPLKVALIKYMILHGRETELGRIPLDIPVTGETLFAVRMDVRGPRFITYIQGQQVDTWTNDQLKTGGVGFLNERAERGKIKTVSISYLNGVDK